jgi:integral membrane sensor domain MASE1
MVPSLRKLIGAILMLVLVVVYALFAMALAEGRVTSAPVWLQPILYAILGLAWVIPAMLIIKWMERPDKKV